MTALVRARGTSVWLILYALGLLCVLSFVFFEILDVDGSDFDAARSRVAIKVAEAPHEALKRGVLGQGSLPIAAAVVTGVAERPTPSIALDRQGRGWVSARSATRLRAALARSRLPDVPPPA